MREPILFSNRGPMVTRWWLRLVRIGVHVALYAGLGLVMSAQGLGGAGTVQGTVKDPSGGVMVAVTVTISNPVSGFKRDTTTDQMGKFVFRNLSPNPYHLDIT